MYDIQELAGGISMDGVIVRLENCIMRVGADTGKGFANIATSSEEIEGGDYITIKNDWDSVTLNQFIFNNLVDCGDIEVYVRSN